MGSQHQDQPVTRHSFAALGVAEAATMFTAQQEQALFALVERGEIALNDLHDKLRLMTVERRLYDANATQAALERLAPDRTLVIDTTSHTPQQVAQKIGDFRFSIFDFRFTIYDWRRRVPT